MTPSVAAPMSHFPPLPVELFDGNRDMGAGKWDTKPGDTREGVRA